MHGNTFGKVSAEFKTLEGEAIGLSKEQPVFCYRKSSVKYFFPLFPKGWDSCICLLTHRHLLVFDSMCYLSLE